MLNINWYHHWSTITDVLNIPSKTSMSTMKLQLVLFDVFAILILHTVECKHWAVLVAGSRGYINYRHQADVCHAYQLLRRLGLPSENIITMMYDDIAHHRKNPFQGNIVNVPNGPNVYEGVRIDYKGKDVTPHNFLQVSVDQLWRWSVHSFFRKKSF